MRLSANQRTYTNRHSQGCSTPARTASSGLALLSALLLTMASPLSAASERQGTVLLSNETCGYVLLDLGNGQALVKMIDGEQPRPGDRLRGPMEIREFNSLENQRTREQITVWTDMIERSSTRALSRYSQNCQR